MANFQWTEGEYVAASIGSHNRRIGRTVILLVLAFCLISSGFGVQRLGLVMVPVGAAAGALVGGLVLLVAKSRMRVYFRQHSMLRETFHLTFTADGIGYAYDSGTYFQKWAQLRWWSEDKRFLYLFESEASVRMIPKRALSPDEEQRVRSCLSALPKK